MRCPRRLNTAVSAVVLALESRLLFAATPPSLWTTQGPGGGGSYFSANLSGNDLWVASDMSGIYHSPDLGATWQMQNFHTAAGGINGGTASQVQFTSDPNILYIPGSNLGVAKSSNGAATR